MPRAPFPERFRLYQRLQVGYTSLSFVLPSVPFLSPSVFRGCDRSLCRVFTGCAALAALLLVTSSARLAAAEPHIYLIEKLSTNQVTVHFNTDANRTYTLQFLDSLSCPTNGSVACSSSKVPTGSWSNLWTAPRLPFTNHYIVADFRTNRMRFYRLRVTP